LKYESQRIGNWDSEVQNRNEELARQQNFVISEREYIEMQKNQLSKQRTLSSMYIPTDLKKVLQGK